VVDGESDDDEPILISEVKELNQDKTGEAEYRRVTNGRTDRQTNILRQHSPR